MDEQKFEKVLNTAIMQSGFEDTVISTLYPFFEKIGILWQTGTVNPAQEHFITHLVRQKLIVGIDGIVERRDANSKHFMLYLPEGELHELGLLFYYYLLKRRGHKVTYLGQWVPLVDIGKVGKYLQPDYILTSFYASFNGTKLDQYLQNLSQVLPSTKIWFTTIEQEAG